MGVIGRYETLKQIGDSSTGVLYWARDIVLDRDVALKVVRIGPEFNIGLRERFYREAKAAADLQHPNIATVYELGEANDALYFAIEFLHGADLRRHIQEARPRSLAQKIELLAQVCDGLAYAHRNGMVHRAIEPGNILIHDNRQSKILNFGTASLLSSKLAGSSKATSTLNYLSPEQIAGRVCDARSDLFSAAIVFFEFLVFAHPFQSAFIPRRIAEDEPDSLFDRDPLIPRSLDQLLKKALVKTPEDRIQTAEEFGAGLRAVLDDLCFGLVPHLSRVRSVVSGSGAVSNDEPVAQNAGALQRMSEFICLVKKFEQALRIGDGESAQATAEQMKKMAASDSTFLISVEACEQQLAEALGKGWPVSVAVVTGSRHYAGVDVLDERTAHQTGFRAGGPASNGPATNGSSQTGWSQSAPAHTLHGIVDRNPSPAPATMGNRFSREIAARASELGRQCSAFYEAAYRPVLRWYDNLPSLHKQIAALMTFVMVVVIGAILTGTRPEPVEQSAAQASVQVDHADLLDQPKSGARRLVSLQKDTQVNLLVPLDLYEPWVRAQYVSPDRKRNSPPGYLRSAQLGGWSSSDPAIELSLVRLTRPTVDDMEQERRFVNRLMEFAQRFHSTQEATEANLEIARLQLAQALQSKDAEHLTGRREALGRAAEALSKVAPANSSASQIADRDRLKAELEALAREAVPAVPVPDPKIGEQIAWLIRDIHNQWDAGNYSRVLDEVKKVLQLDRNNQNGLFWQHRVTQAMETEKAYEK